MSRLPSISGRECITALQRADFIISVDEFINLFS